jgi:hypothetical protein
MLRRFREAGKRHSASDQTLVQQMHDNAKLTQPRSWPLFGIPTKTETFVVPIDDATAIRCTRSYYSLC